MNGRAPVAMRILSALIVRPLASRTSLGPVIGPLLQVRKVTAAAVADVLTGGDPQNALSAAAQAANDLIANYSLANGG